MGGRQLIFSNKVEFKSFRLASKSYTSRIHCLKSLLVINIIKELEAFINCVDDSVEVTFYIILSCRSSLFCLNTANIFLTDLMWSSFWFQTALASLRFSIVLTNSFNHSKILGKSSNYSMAYYLFVIILWIWHKKNP